MRWRWTFDGVRCSDGDGVESCVKWGLKKVNILQQMVLWVEAKTEHGSVGGADIKSEGYG